MASVLETPVLIGDPENKLTPALALEKSVILASNGHHSQDFSIASKTYWWVKEISNSGSDTEWVVHVGNTSVVEVSFTLFDDNTPIHSENVNLIELAKTSDYDYVVGHHLMFDLPANSTRVVVLRVETPIAHPGLIFIKTKHEAEKESYFHMTAIWGATGAMLALIFYNIFLGYGLRSNFYYLYVGHAVGHLLYLLTALGMIGDTFPIIQRYLLFNIPGMYMGALFGSLFIYKFMDVPKYSKSLTLLFKVFIGYLLLFPLLIVVVDSYQLLAFARYNHLLLAVLVITSGVVGMIKKSPQAIYILVGWGLMIATTSSGMLGVIGLKELAIEDGIIAFAAILFEMFLLSLALADRVRNLYHDKNAAVADNEAKSAFLATMSHEIRTPMNGLLGMADILSQTELTEKQKTYVDTIRYSGSYLLTILNDILDYVRASEGKLKIDNVSFSLNKLIHSLILIAKVKTDEKGLKFEVDIDPDLPEYLIGDPARIRQIFMNLINNAIKFTAHGSINIKLRLIEKSDNDVLFDFSIIDTGIGIDTESMERLFDRFHQADNTISRRYGGTGLGLSIVKELVELMDGNFGVSSELGEGSHFFITLRLGIADNPNQAESKQEEITLAPMRVLVVDDDRISRMVVSSLLVNEGHEVIDVDSGIEAINQLNQTDFDLVLMDISMPVVDGIETTRRIRQMGLTIPVVGLTAHVFPDDHHRCHQAGMNAVETKPLVMQKLKETIAKVLQGNIQA